jgi:hypothetical protein
MSISRSLCWSLCFVLGAGLSLAGCASETTTSETTGSLSLNLEVGNVEIKEVDYLITGEGTAEGGTIDTSAPGSTASVEVFGLLPGDYTVTMSATATDGETTCEGSEDFSVEADELTEIMVYLRCKLPETLGAVRVNGEFNICPQLQKAVASPLQTSVGNDIDLSAIAEDPEGDPIMYFWIATGGELDDNNAQETTYTCQEVGDHTISINVSDDGFVDCEDDWTFQVRCVLGDGPECEMNVDCDDGFVCENFECVPDVECNENDDCDTGEICNDNVCVSDPNLFCNTGACDDDPGLRGQCVDAFLLCLANNIDEDECIAVSLLICNPECTVNEDCDTGEICVDNVCVPDLECTMNEDCDTGEICVDNVCVPDLECTMNEECEIVEICNDNVCVSDPDIFCDEGLCATEPALRAECVQTFLLCLEENPDINDDECVLASLLICRECTTNEGCSAGETCVDNICVVSVSFAAQIQPYFEPGLANCVQCHSEAFAQKGVKLDSYANILAGSVDASGPLVVAGDSSMGILIPKLDSNHNNGPDDAAFVPILARWIDQGAQDN